MEMFEYAFMQRAFILGERLAFTCQLHGFLTDTCH